WVSKLVWNDQGVYDGLYVSLAYDQDGLPATSCRHIAPDGIDFPTLKEGTCTFDSDLAVGGHVSGSFQCVFTTEAGTDRALYGDFDGPLQETGI
ncbi:MAG: hypothetical protein HY906_17115, partial [Deltaproteobacteria bacterium]|nr:hypothetical protein [Deltaproteobacteria bacterium]